MEKFLVTAASLALLGVSASTQAMVTFDNFDDANGASLFYDVGSSTDNGDNTLTIAVDNFLVDENSAVPVAFDTFSFSINAAPGFFITSIDSFEESVSFLSNDADGVMVATGSISVNAKGNNDSRSLGTKVFTGITALTIETLVVDPFEWDISEEVTSVVVTITNSLTAVGSDLSVEKGPASLSVTTAVIPLPAPVMLLGSGLATMLFMRRKPA